MFCCLALDPASPVVPGALEAVARACSPRIESPDEAAVVFDATGLGRVIGTPDEIGTEVRRLAAGHGITVRVCLAATMTAAWIVAHVRAGITVVETGGEAKALAALPLTVLRYVPESQIEPAAGRTSSGRRARHYRMAPGPSSELTQPNSAGMLSIFERWGLRTLGDLARLPRADLRTRLGSPGVRLHEAACGEDPVPLVPSDEPPKFLERLELEWPIEGLEPLSFVVGRLCEALSLTLERADRGAVAITTRLTLVKGASETILDTEEQRLRPPGRASPAFAKATAGPPKLQRRRLRVEARQRAGVGPREQLIFERILNLPAPMRDARVLRTLVLLDLESHPPDAAIEVVELELDVTPGRIAQGSLLTYTLPTPEHLATLLARLAALMGESRVGAPALVDVHDERPIAMRAFQATQIRPPGTGSQGSEIGAVPGPVACLRRFRLPIPARVMTEQGAPIHVEPSARGVPASRVLNSAGPWRTSGRWWTQGRTSWDRDEWDVELTSGVFRLVRDRGTGHWEIEGAMD